MPFRTVALLLLLARAAAGETFPTARLESVSDNRYMTLRYHDADLRCEPYGVRTLEEIAADTATSESCRRLIDRYSRQEPLAALFARRELKRGMMYRFETKEQGCVVFARGRVSYGEWLLSEGLAVIRPGFRDRLYEFRYKQAQTGARRLKKGIWKEPVWSDCVESAK